MRKKGGGTLKGERETTVGVALGHASSRREEFNDRQTTLGACCNTYLCTYLGR